MIFQLKEILEKTCFSIGATYNGTWDSHYGPDGRSFDYFENDVINNTVGSALIKIGINLTVEIIQKLRMQATLPECPSKNNTHPPCWALKKPCLVNIAEDYCELNDLSDT